MFLQAIAIPVPALMFSLTARGGIIVSIIQTLGIPVKWVGMGEKLDDLVPFDPEAFVEGMLGKK